MRRILVLMVLWGISTGVFAEHQYLRFRSSGYYFRPPRTIFYFRPDYLFAPTLGYRACNPAARVLGSGLGCGYGYGHGLGYGLGYGHHEFYGPAQGLGWVAAPRGTYSLYLQSPVGEVVRSNTADLIFSVTPARAMVFLDGKLIGSARDFASERDRFTVLDGVHELRVEYPGYKPFHTELHVEPNRTVHLDIALDPVSAR